MSLSDPTLTDELLIALFNKLPARSIVLLEDIDSAGINGLDLQKNDNTKASVSLSGLLNTIDVHYCALRHLHLLSSCHAPCFAALSYSILYTDRNTKPQASLYVSSFAQNSGVYDSKREHAHRDRFDPSSRVAISQGGVCAL